VRRVTVLPDRVDPRSPDAQANTHAMLGQLALVEQQLDAARAGGGQNYVDRHRARGKLLARERIELLLDRDAPFLELMPVAAYGSSFPVGASVVTGIGLVEGVEVLVIANDPTVRGGASNPYSSKKVGRAMEIARENRLPLVNLVESGGADLPTQAEIFIPGGAMFRNLTQMSAAGIPTIALVFGNSTAGGAYVPGMSDYVVLVKQRAKVFLGGPPLVKMATGEDSDDESLGGAEMHARTSGLADQLAEDEYDAIRLGRDIVKRLNLPQQVVPASIPPRYDEQGLLAIASTDLRVPFDPRDVLARVVDDSDIDEFKPLYGTSLVTAWARIHGYPVGVLANARGVLFSEESEKAAQFIQLANSSNTPLVFLQNRLHGRQDLRAGRHHQGRRQDDQRRQQLDGPPPHAGGRRVLRRRQLRHVRPGVRTALSVLLAAREVRGHGTGAARRCAVHRRPPVRGVPGPGVRRGRGRADAGPGRNADRGGVPGTGQLWAHLRRRHHRPA